MHFFHLPLAFPDSFFGLAGGQIIAIAVPVVVFLVGGTITIVAMYFHHQRKALWHETARLALEKGQPLPVQPKSYGEIESAPPPGVSYGEWTENRRAEVLRNDIKGGLVLVGVGAGLYLFLSTLIGRGLGLVGTIPGFIGLALLLYALSSAAFQRKDAPPPGRPPQT